MAEETKSPFRIRYATVEDNALLAEVGTETFYNSFAVDNTPENMAVYLAESFNPQKLARELGNPASRFLIVEAGSLTAAYAHLRFGQAPTTVAGRQPMEIARFYARLPWIGKGVGALLMQACLREAERAGCDVVWLDVWERNQRAITFYLRWGFAQVGTQVFQLGDDPQRDLLMAKDISPA
ncbi:MAG TPA: GNAT family N-acetyltransferase [Acidobacteriota bacterium]|nr:GNAT family N-acetyltransferase [Acidobacteriota bacterium]